LSIGRVSDEFFDGHTNHATVAAWRAAVSDDSGNAFAELVDEDVILEGSVFPSPIKGREAVRTTIRQSSRLYDRLEFTHETQSTDRTYFEWEGAAFGLPVWGVTAISLGVDGRISRVVLSHRPLDVVVRFSAALADRLAGR
jgi:SnoaL-like domain